MVNHIFYNHSILILLHLNIFNFYLGLQYVFDAELEFLLVWANKKVYCVCAYSKFIIIPEKRQCLRQQKNPNIPQCALNF